MAFVHSPVPLPTITRDENKGGYLTPEGWLPSITRVLGATASNKEALEKWRRKLGHEAAERESARAATRGTDLHYVAEHYLKNADISGPEFSRSLLFPQLRLTLKQHIGTIYAQEAGLYSKRLLLAGTSDLVAEWDGTISIVDFKGSTRKKQPEWIEDYFLQTTGYALMFTELTGIKIRQLVVFIATEETFGLQTYTRKPAEYVEALLARVATYHRTISSFSGCS